MNTIIKFWTKRKKKLLSLMLCGLLIGLTCCGVNLWRAWQWSQTESCDAQSKKVNLGDFGFLSGNPSGPPCYLGLCPQISMKTDVEKTLKKYGMLDYCTMNTRDLDGGVRCNCFSGITFDKNDLISSIVFFPSNDTNVEQVLRKFGEPNEVYLSNYYVIEELSNIDMYFYYDQYQMSMVLTTQKGSSYYVSGQTNLAGVGYESTDSYKESISVYKKVIWKGYGKYDIKDYK